MRCKFGITMVGRVMSYGVSHAKGRRGDRGNAAGARQLYPYETLLEFAGCAVTNRHSSRPRDLQRSHEQGRPLQRPLPDSRQCYTRSQPVNHQRSRPPGQFLLARPPGGARSSLALIRATLEVRRSRIVLVGLTPGFPARIGPCVGFFRVPIRQLADDRDRHFRGIATIR